MKKFIIILTIPVILLATDTRVSTLGGEEELIVDISNIHEYPSYMNYYKNRVVGELGRFSDIQKYQSGFLILPLWKFGTIGLVLHRDHFPEAMDTAMIESGAKLNYEPWFDVMYAMRIKAFSFGVKYEKGGTYHKEGTENHVDYVKDMVNLDGLGGDISLNFKPLTWNFSFIWRFAQFSSETSHTEKKSKGNKEMNIATRFILFPEGKVKIPVFFKYTDADAGWESRVEDTLTESGDINFSYIKTGFGFLYSPTPPLTIITGIYYKNTSRKFYTGDTITELTTVLPGLIVGAEGKIWNWLEGRIGMVKLAVLNENNEPVKHVSSPYDFRSGLTFLLGDFWLDLRLEDEFLFKGPFFIGGSESSAAEISIGYKFK